MARSKESKALEDREDAKRMQYIESSSGEKKGAENLSGRLVFHPTVVVTKATTEVIPVKGLIPPYKLFIPQNFSAFKKAQKNNPDTLKTFAMAAITTKDSYALRLLFENDAITKLPEYFLPLSGAISDAGILLAPTTKANKAIIDIFAKHDMKFLDKGAKILFKHNHLEALITKLPPLSHSPESLVLSQKHMAQAMVNLCKALYAETDQPAFFNKAINSFKLSISSPSGDSSDTHNITLALNTLSAINSCYRHNGTSDLEKYIAATSNVLLSKKQTTLYCSSFTGANRTMLNYTEALEWAKLAYKNYKENPTSFTKKDSLEIVYNMALCIKEYDPEQALLYYTEAEAIDPTDPDIIQDKINVYFHMGKVNEAFIVVNKIADPELRNLILLSAYSKLGQKLPRKLLETLDHRETEPDVTKIILRAEHRAALVIEEGGTVEDSIEVYKEMRLPSATPMESVQTVLKSLEQCAVTNHWKIAPSILRDFYTQFPIAKNHSVLPLKYYEFLCYHLNGFDDLALGALKSLNNDHAPLGIRALSLAKQANHIYLFSLALESQFDLAEDFLANIFIGSEQEKLKIRQIVDILKTKSTIKTIIVVTPDSPVTESIIVKKNIYSLVDWAASAEELDSLPLDQAAIHDYFQDQKAKLCKQTPNSLAKTNFCWNIGKHMYGTDSAPAKIYALDNKPDFYATIDPKILAKLDPAVLKKFAVAISKGVAFRDVGSNGIKFLDGKLIELKIDGDTRLYTKAMYQNDDGKYLIVFDHKGSHAAVKKALALSSGLIKTIQVDTRSALVPTSSSDHDEEEAEVSDEEEAEVSGHTKFFEPSFSSTGYNVYDNPCCWIPTMQVDATGVMGAMGSGGEDY